MLAGARTSSLLQSGKKSPVAHLSDDVPETPPKRKRNNSDSISTGSGPRVAASTDGIAVTTSSPPRGRPGTREDGVRVLPPPTSSPPPTSPKTPEWSSAAGRTRSEDEYGPLPNYPAKGEANDPDPFFGKWRKSAWEEWYAYYEVEPQAVYDFPGSYKVNCRGKHDRREINCFSPEECAELYGVWSRYKDNLDHPKLDAKPILSHEDFMTYRKHVYKLMQMLADSYEEPLCLDQATMSATNEFGHKRHADNLVFGVWWAKRRIMTVREELQKRLGKGRGKGKGKKGKGKGKQEKKGENNGGSSETDSSDSEVDSSLDWRDFDPVLLRPEIGGEYTRDHEFANKLGAETWWKPNSTAHRNFACTVNLMPLGDYTGGEVRFYNTLGQREPSARYRAEQGCGVAFCGCDRNIHEVTPVTEGFRLTLLVWTRPAGVKCPQRSATTHYHRPGTGEAVWLTLEDIHNKAENSEEVFHPNGRASPSPTSAIEHQNSSSSSQDSPTTSDPGRRRPVKKPDCE